MEIEAQAQLIGEAPKPPVVHEVAGLRFQWASSIVPNYMEPGLIDGVLEEQCMTIVYGRSGSGKTAVVVDLACRVAAGLPWRGRETKQGCVLYVAAENSESTRRRIWAWQRRWEVETLPLAVLQSPVMIGPDVVKKVIAVIAEMEEMSGMRCHLVVFDTLARTMAGDENLAKDMGVYVSGLDEVKEVGRCHVLVVHHTGKDEGRGGRGSSALKAACDHELEVSKEGESRTGAITMTKVREGDLEGKRYGFELMPRKLGRNWLGREVTTVVIEEAEAPKRAAAKRTSDTAKRVQAVLDNLGGRVTLKELQMEVGNISTGKGESEQKAWRRLFLDGYLAETPDGYVIHGEGMPDTDIS